ncbi:hypothetical protein PRIPAC_73403, partial [Pristionchus pacificus]
LCIVRDGRPLSRMHFSLQPTTNLKKPQDLPPASTWIDHKSVLIYGDIILYTRNYGIFDKVSSEIRRSCVLTKNGDLIVYMKEKKGFVIDLHSTNALLMNSDKARLKKKKNVLIRRCKVKIRCKFGTINITLFEGEIEKWRDGIYAVLNETGLDSIVETKVASPPMVKREPPKEEVYEEEEEYEENEEINTADISSLYDNTSDMDHSMNNRLDFETYTISNRQTEQPTEQSMKSEVVPHSELLSDAPTPSNKEPLMDEEPTPTALQHINHATFPPHRTANIGFIHPHPPRNLPVFIPPSDAPPIKPPRLSLSKIPVLAPSPAPRRSKTQSIEPSPIIDRPLRKVSRAETFKSDISNDSCESRMPYYKGKAPYVQKSPRIVVSTASIELTPRSDKKSFIRRPLPEEFFQNDTAVKKPSTEMCAHLDDPVRAYIKECYEQTLKDSKEPSPRSTGMESKISFFERSAQDTVPVNRFSTMPRKQSRMTLTGPATLPRSTSSRASVLDLDFSKESAV